MIKWRYIPINHYNPFYSVSISFQMATDSKKNPSEEGPAAADEKKKRKQQSDRKYREKIKKKQESNEAQLKTLKIQCSRYKKQIKFYEKYSMVKPLLDGACKFRKLVLEPGESSGHAREAVEKQTDLVNSLSWELLKTPLPGGGTCGGTSASTDKDACPPLELSVAAMKPDESVTTESFKPCQLLPEQRTPLDKLSELYTASEAQHAREKVKLLKLHAQEMAAAAAQHKQEMAAAAERHAQEMDDVKMEYSLKYLEKENKGLRAEFSDFIP